MQSCYSRLVGRQAMDAPVGEAHSPRAVRVLAQINVPVGADCADARIGRGRIQMLGSRAE
jgi:hypothetical protein